jgi:hypothetical protein
MRLRLCAPPAALAAMPRHPRARDGARAAQARSLPPPRGSHDRPERLLRRAGLRTMPLEVLGSIVRVLDAKSLGRLLCVSRVFSTLVVAVRDSRVGVTVAEYVCFLRYEQAFAELARAWELEKQGRVYAAGHIIEYADDALAGPLRRPRRAIFGRGDLSEAEKSQVLREWVSYIEGAWRVLLGPAVDTLFMMCEAGWPTLQRPPGKTLFSAHGSVHHLSCSSYSGANTKMYDSIGAACARYLTDTVNPRLLVALECSTSALLEELGRRWRHYRTLAQSVGTIFHYLDRYYTVLERIPAVNPRTARKGEHSGGPLALTEVAFRDIVLPQLGDDRLDALRTAARRRDGSPGCDWASVDDFFERIGFVRAGSGLEDDG